VLPYTNFMALYDAGAPVKIVAGGGVQGVYIVAQPGLDTPAKLKGKTLGTFQNDTLEVLPYDWLKKNGVSYKDVTVRYMDSMGDMVAAFKAGSIDIASTIEPYGSSLLSDVKGSVLLSDGVDIYGPEYTDCVLAASTELLKKDPKSVKALIKAMLKAQLLWEQDRETLLGELVGDDPIDLLGHRAVEGAQARLQVRDRDTELDRHERRCQRGVDVARHEHEIRTLGLQYGLYPFHHPRGLHGMAGRAHAEHVLGRRHIELLEEDVGHQTVVVLTGVYEHMARVRPAVAQLGYDRRHLHKIRASANHIGDPHGTAK